MNIEEMLQDYRDSHEIGRLDMFEELADRYYEQQAELSALRARVEALGHLESVAADVNQWLKRCNMGGTAHQRELEAALAPAAPE